MTPVARIRTVVPADAAPLSALAGELGYPTTTEEMRNRIEGAASDPHHAIYVAEMDAIVGWIHMSVNLSLESGISAEIRGLIVTEACRGGGVGSMLVAAGEAWAKKKGCRRIRVRTNAAREKAQAFYAKLGYRITKTQEVFDKELAGSGNAKY